LAARFPVTAQYPYNILFVFIPVGQPTCVCRGILFIKYLRAFAPGVFEYFITPCWQQSYIDVIFVGFVNDIIHMLEIFLIWLERIIVNQRPVTVCIRRMQPV
jgi:hypothetical protein